MDQTNELIFCGSFAKKAGMMGSIIHTAAAKFYGLNFAYKSFAVDDIGDAIKAMRVLKLRGVGISMPYKIEVIKHLDDLSEEAKEIGAVNTVINDDGKLIGHNTDWIAAKVMIKRYSDKSKVSLNNTIYVFGNGGFAKAVCYAAKQDGYSTCCLGREDCNNISKYQNHLFFNCTPVENVNKIFNLHESNTFIDGLTSTSTGKSMAAIQAGVQFQLYTNKEFPLSFLKRAGIV